MVLTDDYIGDWRIDARKRMPKDNRKGFDSIIMLICWLLWKHRNRIVFDGEAPSLGRLLAEVLIEGRAWRMTRLLKSDLESFFGRLHT